MNLTKDELARIPVKVPTFTPEQIAAAQAKAAERKAKELGMCRADCPECGGIGWLSEDGKVTMCPNVDRWSLPSASRYGISRMEYETLGFEKIRSEKNDVALASEALWTAIERGYGWVFLHGDYGIGKTYLLKIAIAEAIRMGYDSSYVRMAEVIDDLRSGFADNATEPDTAKLNWWSGLKVLAIDELDRLRETPYGSERRFILLDRRYEQACRQESVTIFASNQSPDGFPGYLADRILDGRFSVIGLSGESLRKIMRY